MNRQIRTSYVRVIGKEGEQLGILDTRKAIELANSLNLDLVEVSPGSDPPVCKIMDYGKYKYQQKKKAQVAKKNQVIVEIKEIQLRPKTEFHDLEHKANNVRGFLEEGDKAKVSVFFRGREMEHVHMGYDTLREFAALLQDGGILESTPKLEGKRLTCIFAPLIPGKKPLPGALLESMPKGPPANFRRGGGDGYNSGGYTNQVQSAAVQPSATVATASPVEGSGNGGTSSSSK